MILLFGSTGYIGSEFKRQLNQQNIPTKCWEATSTTTFEGLHAWYQYVNNDKIDFVINAAGFTGKPNVDVCELNKSDTIIGNLLWPQLLTHFCLIHDVPVGHVSSGCVYNGRLPNGNPYTEENKPNFSFANNNCSFYSGTKVLAETITSQWEKSYNWRLKMPFEHINNPRNFLSKLLNYPKLIDTENSLSNKKEFVRACIDSFQLKIPYGIYNVTNTGSITSKEIVERMKKTITKERNFEFVSEEFFYNSLAKAPRANCVLDNSKLVNAGVKMTSVDESLDNCLNNWNWNQ